MPPGDQPRSVTSPASIVLLLPSVMAWPLLFGKFTCDDFAAIVSHRGEGRLVLTELTSAQAVQVGAIPPSGLGGIGAMIIADTFQVA